MVFGTPLYISPEQIQGVKNVDYRTDLYSFAVIAYLLTTGYHPFSGSTAQITAFQHMVEPPPPPSQLNPRLPQVFDDILVKGLAKAPADRYESASAQAAALAAAAQLDPLVEVMVLMRQPTPIISRSEPSRTGAITGPAATIQLDPPPPAPPPPPSRHFARFALIGLLLLRGADRRIPDHEWRAADLRARQRNARAAGRPRLRDRDGNRHRFGDRDSNPDSDEHSHSNAHVDGDADRQRDHHEDERPLPAPASRPAPPRPPS